MRSGHIYILLSLLSYSSLGILHKVAEVRKCRPLPISLLMCGWCLLALVFAGLIADKSLSAPSGVVGLALPVGICAGVAILALQSALSLGDISTSWLAINLSAGIPTVLSIILYNEPITWLKGLALIAMAVSMILLWKDAQMSRNTTDSAPESSPD